MYIFRYFQYFSSYLWQRWPRESSTGFIFKIFLHVFINLLIILMFYGRIFDIFWKETNIQIFVCCHCILRVKLLVPVVTTPREMRHTKKKLPSFLLTHHKQNQHGDQFPIANNCHSCLSRSYLRSSDHLLFLRHQSKKRKFHKTS